MIIEDSLDFCLLIPCYNNYRGLIESLRTVNYHSQNYFIVIIDDGSAVPLAEKDIQAVMGNGRFIILRNENKSGITRSLNSGLSWIRENLSTKYIARLDCGDLCMPDRFEMQVAFLDANPAIDLVGSWCLFREKDGSAEYSYKTPVSHREIMREMHFRNVFIHPTVIFRASVLEFVGYYPVDFEFAEDYAFFWKIANFRQSFVLNKCLVICEINKEGLSYKNRRKQLLARWKVVKNFSSNPFLRIASYVKHQLLQILPGELVLKYKKLKG